MQSFAERLSVSRPRLIQVPQRNASFTIRLFRGTCVRYRQRQKTTTDGCMFDRAGLSEKVSMRYPARRQKAASLVPPRKAASSKSLVTSAQNL